MSYLSDLDQLGYEEYYDLEGNKGWKKDGKYYEWEGSGNPNATGVEKK
jgi:hypothetical protein